MPEPTAGIVVFAGPSLPRRPDAGWQSLLGRCDLRPPAGRGDVLAALASHPRTIVLLDGYYFTVPSVSHKEILYALDGGVRVIGAASLGALRAVELETFGMAGVGTIFDWYRSGTLDGDDEVALLHAPAENGYRGITVALVEVRHAVDRLAAASGLPSEAGRRLIESVKALSFLDRHPDRIEELARVHLGEAAARALACLLAAGGLKQEDARQALAIAVEAAPGRVARRRTPTGYLSFYKEAYLRCPPGGPQSPSLQRAWRMAQLFHPDAPNFVREIRLRSLLVAAACRQGIAAPPELVAKRDVELRQFHLDAVGAAFLPETEYVEEARFAVLAELACCRLGGIRGALDTLARTFGLPVGDTEALLRIAAGGAESLPPWWLVRAFCLSSAFPAAVAVAVAAGEVHRCFLRWADGVRIVEGDLERLAAGLWSCPEEKIPQESARRGLFPSFSLSEGLLDALELVAAAERLPRPVNDYPEKRDALARVALTAGDSEAALRHLVPGPAFK